MDFPSSYNNDDYENDWKKQKHGSRNGRLPAFSVNITTYNTDYKVSSNNNKVGGGGGVDSGYTVYYYPMNSSNGNNNNIITPDDWFVGCYLVMVAAADKLIRS